LIFIFPGASGWAAAKLWRRENIVAAFGPRPLMVGDVPYADQYGGKMSQVHNDLSSCVWIP